MKTSCLRLHSLSCEDASLSVCNRSPLVFVDEPPIAVSDDIPTPDIHSLGNTAMAVHVHVIMFCLCSFFLERQFQRLQNGTHRHGRKWAVVENGSPKFGSPFPLNAGPNAAHFRLVLRRHCDFSANIFGTKRAIGKRKKSLNYDKFPTFLQNLVNLSFKTGEMTWLLFTAQ